MKKSILLLICFMLTVGSFAQLIQASLGPGSLSNRVKVYLRPAATQTPTNISTLQFDIAIPAVIIPKPTLTVVSTAFVGVTWQVTTATEGGYYHFILTTPNAPININTTANTEFEALEVQFSGGTTADVSLVTLPDGGSGETNGNALFYSTGSLQSDGSNLYYVRSGIAVSNQFSYDETGATNGTTTSFATIANISLPLRWNSFNVVRQADDAMLSWDVSSEEETLKYVVERSIDGFNFVALGDVQKTAGSGNKKYNYLDKKIQSLGSKVIHYRIRNVDIQNRSLYSATKNVRLDMKGDIGLFPNPAKEGFTLTIPYVNPDQQRVQLHLVNGLGQVVERKDITRLAAANYYYNLQSSLIVSGEYLLKIFEDGKLSETKMVLIKK